MAELDLLVVGDINPDLIVAGGQLEPTFNQVEQLVDRVDLVVGGSASITAIGAARLGLQVGLCGVVGDDPLGRLMVEGLAAEGIDTDRVRVDGGRTTGATVVLDRGDDRAILTAPGCISALGPADLDALGDQPARHVHVASYFLMSEAFRRRLPHTFRSFRAHAATTSIDTNWDPSQQWALSNVLDVIDVLLPNRSELVAISGLSDPIAALTALGAQVPTVVVKLGDQGAAAHLDGSIFSVQAPPAPSFRDSIGAGDSFNAAFLAGVLSGWSVQEAVRLAVAAGTLSTAGVGGSATQPDLVTAREFAQSLTVHPGFEGSM